MISSTVMRAVLIMRVDPPKTIYKLRRDRRFIVFTSAFIADPTDFGYILVKYGV